jgi:hypothetical protein
MNEKIIEINEELYNRFFEIVGSPEEGNSQSKAAQAIGYSSGVVSAYKSIRQHQRPGRAD